MARKPRTTITIDEKISEAKEKVIKCKEKYDKAVSVLDALLSKRDELRRKELLEAINKSDHTYEEILCFIRG